MPVTVVIAVRNEEKNIVTCVSALNCADEIVVVDSSSTDATADLATGLGAKVIQFQYQGGYPKKRQWLLDNYEANNEWIMLVDADEVVTASLWSEIRNQIAKPTADAFLVKKEFHFLGKRFRFGGFSHRAVLLFRRGSARFEHLFDDSVSGMDMEIHERLIVSGKVGGLHSALVHHDFKGLHSYISRHNSYSNWEAHLRHRFHLSKTYGRDSIEPRLLGNVQERRRFLKKLIMSLPFEPWIWFFYHFVLRLGFLEGRRGLIACQIRSNYIREVKAKMFEIELNDHRKPAN